MIEIFIDGSCLPVNPKGAACYGYIVRRTGKVVTTGSGIVGKGEGMTNNVAEYNALIHALEEIRKLRLEKERIIVKSDSNLVVCQMKKEWKVKAPLLVPLHLRATKMAEGLDIIFRWIPREENEEADRLARRAYLSLAGP